MHFQLSEEVLLPVLFHAFEMVLLELNHALLVALVDHLVAVLPLILTRQLSQLSVEGAPRAHLALFVLYRFIHEA